MRVLVLEDERPALEQLLTALQAWDPDVDVVATLDSVRDAVRWLLDHPEPDVVLADIRLSDGRSMDVFRRAPVKCPVVFVTAYDTYTQEALEVGGIDYVYKPVRADRLARALDKVLRLEAHFRGSEPATGHRRRLLIRRGSELRTLAVDEVAWFTTENRLVLAVTRDGGRHPVDKTLATLEGELDPQRFFRVGRGCIVGVDAVRALRPHGKGRVALTLDPPGEAVVSAELAVAFKEWMDR
ncbi:MAG: response regulator transcription factor [Alphaproteobacteria bacterium]|nr:response regulator transcription factor [Alphaproteobacteria bacterium]